MITVLNVVLGNINQLVVQAKCVACKNRVENCFECTASVSNVYSTDGLSDFSGKSGSIKCVNMSAVVNDDKHKKCPLPPSCLEMSPSCLEMSPCLDLEMSSSLEKYSCREMSEKTVIECNALSENMQPVSNSCKSQIIQDLSAKNH